MQLLKNEQPQRKGLLREEKSQKVICKKRHRINNPRRTIYCKVFKPKMWQRDIYYGFCFNVSYGNHGIKHDKPTRCRNTSHCRKQWNPYRHKTWLLAWLSEMWQKKLTLSDTAIITGLHANLFSMTQAIKKFFQVMS